MRNNVEIRLKDITVKAVITKFETNNGEIIIPPNSELKVISVDNK